MTQNSSRFIRLTATRGPAAVPLIRLYVGVVFAAKESRVDVGRFRGSA